MTQRSKVQRSMWLDRGQANWLESEVARRNAAREEDQPRATKTGLMAEAIQAIGGPPPAAPPTREGPS